MIALMEKNPANPETPDERPRGAGHYAHKRITVTLTADLEAALAQYLDRADVRPRESDVLRAAIREFLKKAGCWPPPPDKQQTSSD
ncbi:ribbon-helix-helix domain-containing protein [Tuwongella immobilis]|uniref:Ribbon-helix-helix protein CopG domain-containing protein n=1 Tax=Tuwongella immobilis TaxID=692036 RepID=A0A6C2YR28_9BACT|nr:hypothetical protein [Tuwongella immobilis]VIP03936.1 unnamed protein product [Tuwongella immobilis]VTS05239.1 unnamed protein product [Tuwongella immobilis]